MPGKITLLAYKRPPPPFAVLFCEFPTDGALLKINVAIASFIVIPPCFPPAERKSHQWECYHH
jgi:hypothetical protein